MKSFEEIKKSATELKDKTVTFCKDHKEGIKNAVIFVGGLGLSYVLTKDYYTPRSSEGTETHIVKWEDGSIGYCTRTYNKHGKERKQIRECVGFDSLDVAMRIGQDLIRAVREERGEYGRYIWEPEQKPTKPDSRE